LLVRARLGLAPGADASTLDVARPDLSSLPDLVVERLHVGGGTVTLSVDSGAVRVAPADAPARQPAPGTFRR
jgi:hypothetical protein